jgi:mRNA-degrading endonuclease toxin of MazEF toxin-antitoxin module
MEFQYIYDKDTQEILYVYISEELFRDALNKCKIINQIENPDGTKLLLISFEEFKPYYESVIVPQAEADFQMWFPQVETYEEEYFQGDIVIANLPKFSDGHSEIHGRRPCLILFNSGKNSKFSLVIVAPLTTKIDDRVRSNLNLYPILPNEITMTGRNSAVLLDQIRSIDVRKIKSKVSHLDEIYKNMIVNQVKVMFDLGTHYNTTNSFTDEELS